MKSAVVIVIRNDGIKVIRFVASTLKEEKEAMALYSKIQRPINSIQKILENRNH